MCPYLVPEMEAISWRFRHSLELPRGVEKLALRQGMGLVLCHEAQSSVLNPTL